MYYDYALAAPALTNTSAKTGQILILGMGTGTFASQCQHYFPDFSIEGVEIDRKITTLAHDYFSLSPAIPVATYDGRAYLTATDKKYDVIMVDAYQDITIPFYMSSIEFFQLVKNHLSDEGIMVVNMNMHSDGNNGINAYLADTIAAVFPHVATIDVPGATNRELFASTRTIKKNALQEQAQNTTHNDLAQLLHQANNRWTPYERGSLILTDDKAPVETLGMHTLDEIIQKEAGSSRDELQILARNILQKN